MGNLSRKFRRQRERETGREDRNKQLKRAMAQRQEESKFLNEALEVMYYMLGVAANDVYGFGKQRLLKLFNRLDEMIGEMNRGEVTLETMKKRLEELGLELEINV